MTKLLIKWVAFAFVVMFVAWLIPGVEVENFLTAMIATVVIVFVNAFIKPILKLLTLPINILSLGLFTLVINALLFMFVAYVVPGVSVDGFLSALLGSIVLAILSVGVAWI